MNTIKLKQILSTVIFIPVSLATGYLLLNQDQLGLMTIFFAIPLFLFSIILIRETKIKQHLWSWVLIASALFFLGLFIE